MQFHHLTKLVFWPSLGKAGSWKVVMKLHKVMKLEIDCFSAHFQISLIIFHDIYKIQEFFFDPIQFSIFLNMYNHLKTEYKVSNSFLFIGLSEKMPVFAETGNLCQKKEKNIKTLEDNTEENKSSLTSKQSELKKSAKDGTCRKFDQAAMFYM